MRGYRPHLVLLVVATATVSLWICPTGRAQEISVRPAVRTVAVPADGVRHHAAVITALAVQPSGDLVAAAGDDHVVRLWRRDGRVVRRLTGHEDWIRALAFAPDGTTLISAGNDGQVIIWDVADGSKRAQISAGGPAVTALVISHRGDWLASAGFHDPLRMYALRSGALLRELNCPCRDIRALAVAPDDQYLAAGGRDGVVRIFDAASGRMVAHADAHRRRIRALTFTCDGTQLISAGEDRQVCVWPWQSEGTAFRLPISAKVLSLALCGNGLIAAGCSDNSIRIWNLDTRLLVTSLTEHTGSVAALAFQNGVLVSGGYDTVIRFWEIDRSQRGDLRSARRTNLP